MARAAPVDPAQFRSLREVMGDQLLAYAMSVPPADIAADYTPRGRRAAVVQRLINEILGPVPQERDPDTARTMLISSLGLPPPRSELSLINQMREYAGGVVPSVELDPDDKVLASVMPILRDTWATYLVLYRERPLNTFFLSTSVGVMRHKDFVRALRAVVEDLSLRKFFPEPLNPNEGAEVGHSDSLDGLIHVYGFVVSNESAGGVQVAGLVSNAISMAAFRTFARGELLSLDSLATSMRAVLDDMRQLAEGNPIEAEVLVGFAGFSIPDGEVLHLPGLGTMRAATEVDRRLLLADARGIKTVLMTVAPVQVFSIKSYIPDGTVVHDQLFSPEAAREASEMREGFNSKMDGLRMALLLSSSDETPWLAAEVGRYVPDLLAHGGARFSTRAVDSLRSFELPVSRFDEVRYWLRKLNQSDHSKSLSAAQRRALIAATVRDNSVDAFVDAVMVWESLLGVRTETVFRVTAAMAKLLEPDDYAARRNLAAELKKIYGIRSRIVHGSQEVPHSSEIEKLRIRSQAIASECFRRLYRDRADLLALDSQERSDRLIFE